MHGFNNKTTLRTSTLPQFALSWIHHAIQQQEQRSSYQHFSHNYLGNFLCTTHGDILWILEYIILEFPPCSQEFFTYSSFPLIRSTISSKLPLFNQLRDSLWLRNAKPWPMKNLAQCKEECNWILYSSLDSLDARTRLLDTLCHWLQKALQFNLALLWSVFTPPIWSGNAL
jgi:hypothetical protein